MGKTESVEKLGFKSPNSSSGSRKFTVKSQKKSRSTERKRDKSKSSKRSSRSRDLSSPRAKTSKHLILLKKKYSEIKAFHQQEEDNLA